MKERDTEEQKETGKDIYVCWSHSNCPYPYLCICLNAYLYFKQSEPARKSHYSDMYAEEGAGFPINR